MTKSFGGKVRAFSPCAASRNPYIQVMFSSPHIKEERPIPRLFPLTTEEVRKLVMSDRQTEGEGEELKAA